MDIKVEILSFQHIRCVGVGVYASICEKCGRVIAWSPAIETLRIAEFAHESRHTLGFPPEEQPGTANPEP